ncbi:MAG: amidohydrolase family protein [Bryobacterales bacterium]|jgi:predicted TIM-barrel fold metal-dependent hydrolase|nr:amidohydrolase family protein [Bryobacterales bacterium]
MFRHRLASMLFILVGLACLCQAQDRPANADIGPQRRDDRPERPLPPMSFVEYDPKSTLVVAEHPVTRAKFPVIDIHSHHNPRSTTERIAQVVKDMDALNVRMLVNLSGGQGENIKIGAEQLLKAHPGRFVIFANLDFWGIDEPGWGEGAARQLEEDYRNGARGLKIFKNLGLNLRDKKGRVPTDDPRLDPVWRKCAELNMPVLIHTGEPASFFDPIDKNNERWLELSLYPSRARPADTYPSWEVVMAEQHRLFEKHPKTIFINAHLGWYANDLAKLAQLLDRLPNMYTEIGAVIAELGRQPRAAREFLIRYQDRVLFGKDSWVPGEFTTYFRTLETADEYFPYHKRYHAFWRMYGLSLPDDVLKKIYFKNALKLLPHIDASQFPK